MPLQDNVGQNCRSYLSCNDGGNTWRDYVTNACVPEMEPFLSVFEQTGCSIYTGENKIYMRCGTRLKAIPDRIRTMPHPGFPTDAQAVLMAALITAEGTSVLRRIFLTADTVISTLL